MNSFITQMHAFAVWAEMNGFDHVARACRKMIEDAKGTLVLIVVATFGLIGCSENEPKLLHCQIEIRKSGVYTLDRDVQLEAGQNCAIGIFAEGAILDLNGKTVTGLGVMAVENFGVFGAVSNITVKNGTIKNFGYGVAFLDSAFGGGSMKGRVVESLHVEGSTYSGITVEGSGSIVKNNTVTNTGGGSFQGLFYVYGIAMRGPGCLVEGNTVSETYPDRVSAEGVAVSFSTNNDGCVMRSNTITQSTPTLDKNTFGIWIDVYSQVHIDSNNISGMHYSGVIPTWTTVSNNTLDVPFIHAITDR
jgi:hypothetical protein